MAVATAVPAQTGSNLIVRAQRVIGNSNATLLFQRVAYWMPRARVKRREVTWIAKSAADWRAETGLTPKVYKTALAHLKRLGLVVTEQHLFGGKNLTYLRLTAPGEQLAYTGPAEKAQMGPPEKAQMGSPEKPQVGQPEKAQVGPLHIQGATNKELQTTVTTGCVTPASQSDADVGPGMKEDSGKEEKTDMKPPEKSYSVHDVKPKGMTKLHKPKNTSELEMIWKQVVPEVYGDFVPAFTVAEKAQLKRLLTVCPEGTAPAVLEHCLRDWVYFTNRAETDAGAYKLPAKPTLGFLVKYVGVAVNVWLDKTKPKQVTPPKSKPAPKPKPQPKAPVQSTAQKPEEEKATLDELNAILGTSIGKK